MKKDRLEEEFEKDSVIMTILKFSLPSAFASIIALLCVITDRYFIGQVAGRSGMAAITIVYPYMLLINGISFLFSGVGIIIGIKLGQKRRRAAELYLGSTFFWIFFLGFILTAIMIFFNDQFIVFFGGTHSNIEYAREYTRYIIPSTIFQIILAQTMLLRAIGEPVKAMVINVATAVINIILDYIFVLKLNMGISGAALATLIATGITSLSFLYYISKSDILKLRRRNMVPNIKILTEVSRIGSPRLYNQLFQAVLVVITNKNAGFYGGEIATAAIGIISVVRNTINTAMQGFNQGTVSIVSYYYGAKKNKKMVEVMKIQLKIVISFTIFMVGLMLIYSKEIAEFFVKNDKELILETARVMRLNLFLMVFTAIFLSCNNFMQAIKQSVLASRYFLLRVVVLNIPLIYILGKLFGINGVWLAFPIADTLAGGAIFIHVTKILKMFDKEKITVYTNEKE